MKSIDILNDLNEDEQKIFLEILDSLNEDEKKILISLSLDEVTKKIYEHIKEKILDSLNEDEKKIFLEILDSLNEDEKKILISLSLDEVTKKIYEHIKEKILDSLNEDEKKVFLKILDSLNEDEQKIFLKILDSLNEDEQKIFLEILDSLNEDEKKYKIFLKILDSLKEEEQKIILSKKLEPKKYYITYARYYQYKLFITANNIEEEYIKYDKFKQILEEIKFYLSNNQLNPERNNEKDNDNKFDDISGELQELREASYRLILKYKKENNAFYKKNKLDKLEKVYFDDLKRKYYIKKENKNFHINKIEILKKIEDFKKNVYDENESYSKLQDISLNRIYIDSTTMFDFLIYIFENYKEIEIFNSEARYSYEYFKKNLYKNKTIMLDELFRIHGFSFKVNEDSSILSFQELCESTYNTNEEWQIKKLDKYEKHPYKIYLLYTLSKNKSISKKIKYKIIVSLNKLPFLYPYDEDILYLLSSIKDNLKTIEIKVNNKDEKKQDTKNNEIDERIKLTIGYEYFALEYWSNEIMKNKNNDLSQYFISIHNFLLALNSLCDNEIPNKDKKFKPYINYIFNLFEEDYRIKYFEKYYLGGIIHKLNLDISSDSYEIKLFLDYLYIKTIFIMTNSKLVSFIFDNLYMKEKVKSNFKLFFEYLKKLFMSSDSNTNIDRYLNFRNEQYLNGKVIFYERYLIRLGYQLSKLDVLEELEKKEFEKFQDKIFEEDKIMGDFIDSNFFRFEKEEDYKKYKDRAYNEAMYFHELYLDKKNDFNFDKNGKEFITRQQRLKKEKKQIDEFLKKVKL